MEHLLLTKIKNYHRIIIFGHMNPDGDCYGSQVALKEIIKANFPEKEVYIVGTGVPALYPVFGKLDIIPDEYFHESLGILVDLNERCRSEDKRVYLCKELGIIDHHHLSEDAILYEKTSYINSKYASCASVLYEIANLLHAQLSLTAKNALLYAIVSDTNRFLYIEDNHVSLSYGYQLIEGGADLRLISSHSQIINIKDFKLKSYILANYKEYNGRIFYCKIPLNFLKSIGYERYAGWQVGLLGHVQDHPIWVLFVEEEDDYMSVELRSNTYIVVDVAAKYGGGGHDYASGITHRQLGEDIVESVLKDLDNLIDGSK